MIYTVPYVMFLMRADPLRGLLGGGWALEIETCGALKWRRAKRVPFGLKKVDSVSANKNKNANIILIRYKNRFFSQPPIHLSRLDRSVSKTQSRISYAWPPFKILQLVLWFAIYFYVCMGTYCRYGSFHVLNRNVITEYIGRCIASDSYHDNVCYTDKKENKIFLKYKEI
jgi:hypothetical protein